MRAKKPTAPPLGRGGAGGARGHARFGWDGLGCGMPLVEPREGEAGGGRREGEARGGNAAGQAEGGGREKARLLHLALPPAKPEKRLAPIGATGERAEGDVLRSERRAVPARIHPRRPPTPPPRDARRPPPTPCHTTP